MPRYDTNRRAPARRRGAAAGALLLALLAGLLLAACGSSKSTSSTTRSTSAAATSPSPTRGAFGARATALRTCLKEHGITLPERKARPQGQRPSGPLGLGAGGGFKLPKGVTRAQLQEAFKKCGGTIRGGRFGARNPQRLAKFAACMRQNGVDLPAPNTSGKGPVFDTNGIDTTSATFKKADAKCVGELRPSGAAPGSGPRAGGAPPGEPPA